MKPLFDVRIVSYTEVNLIAGSWSAEDYQHLLKEMEFAVEDTSSESELREICVMCLQDKSLADAAKTVLKYRMQGKLTPGQIQSVAEEISEEKHWEHYADQTLHEEFFHVGNLMFAAFPEEMDEPDAVQLIVDIEPKNPAAVALLTQPLQEAFVVRLLGDGMAENAILRRLFEEQLKGQDFPEANTIVWIINPKSATESKTTIEVFSSCHWLDALKDVSKFESTATPDVDDT